MNCTVIIPTHNRHNYFKRITSYWGNSGINVVIVDSTENPISNEFPANITYYHVPGTKFAQKILFALENIDTELVALCADDDFLIVESLIKGVRIMNSDNSIAVVKGDIWGFEANCKGNFFKVGLSVQNTLNPDGLSRVRDFLKNYSQILWCLYRKDYLFKSFEIINKSNLQNDNFIELILSTYLLYKGGLRKIKGIWLLREISSSNHWGKRHKNLSEEENHIVLNRIGRLVDSETEKDLFIRAFNYYLARNRMTFIKSLCNKIETILLQSTVKQYKRVVTPAD